MTRYEANLQAIVATNVRLGYKDTSTSGKDAITELIDGAKRVLEFLLTDVEPEVVQLTPPAASN